LIRYQVITSPNISNLAVDQDLTTIQDEVPFRGCSNRIGHPVAYSQTSTTTTTAASTSTTTTDATTTTTTSSTHRKALLEGQQLVPHPHPQQEVREP